MDERVYSLQQTCGEETAEVSQCGRNLDGRQVEADAGLALRFVGSNQGTDQCKARRE